MRRLNLNRYVIDGEFQFSFILRSILLLVFVMLSTFVMLIVWNQVRFYQGYLLSPPSAQQVTAWAQAHQVPTDSPEFALQYVAQAKPYTLYSIMFVPLVVITLVNAVVIGLATLYISYKISVPLHELKEALRSKIETGNFERLLTIRKDGPFHELISLANLAFYKATHHDGESPPPSRKK